jgi:hypothetical protein
MMMDGCLLCAWAVQVEGEEHEQKYSRIFHLLPSGGSYWVQNEMFRYQNLCTLAYVQRQRTGWLTVCVPRRRLHVG